MAKPRNVSSIWVVIIFHCIVLLFHHVTVVSGYTCSRCTSEDSKSSFSDDDPDVWECKESESSIDNNDFTRIPEFGNTYNDCDCRQQGQQTTARYCCELEERPVDDAICRCEDRCYDGPACPANKCDYSFQCDTTLYVCWNLISPQDLGIFGSPTDSKGSTNGESDDSISSTDNGSSSTPSTSSSSSSSSLAIPEIEEIVYCRDRKDKSYIYEAPGEVSCGTFCSPMELQAVNDDDPNDSSIIGIKVCPNDQTVTQYTKFCSPTNEEGRPSDGLSFTSCPGGSGSECILPFCDYENEFTLTTTTREGRITINCPDDITLDILYTHDGHPLPISVEYDDPVIVVPDSSSLSTILLLQQSKGLSSGSMFPVGTTTNTYQVISRPSDGGSGTTILSTCSFDISIMDNQPPMINCPTDMTIDDAYSSCNTVTVYYGPIETYDNSPGMLTVVQLNGLSSGSPFPVGRTTRNTFQVTDTWGNTNTCSFDVHVVGDGDQDCSSNRSSSSSSSSKSSSSSSSKKSSSSKSSSSSKKSTTKSSKGSKSTKKSKKTKTKKGKRDY